MHDVYDMHGHFLPEMDDGSRSTEESVQMLRAAYEQGVRYMCATPHYYPVETVDAFLSRRQKAADALERKMAGQTEPLPRICYGAEVAFRVGLENETQLDKLCLGKSRYLLLEMPFVRWGKDVIRSLHNICNTRGVIPIIAHLERYLGRQSAQSIHQLLQADVLVQVNTGQFERCISRRKACGLLRSGVVQLLGSDCHNTTDRAPNMGAAVEYLQKHGMQDVLEHINRLSADIFAQAMGER